MLHSQSPKPLPETSITMSGTARRQRRMPRVESCHFPSLSASGGSQAPHAAAAASLLPRRRRCRWPALDDSHGVRLYLAFFGLLMFLPWNFYFLVNDYWMYRFQNSTRDGTAEYTELQVTLNFIGKKKLTLNQFLLQVSLLTVNRISCLRSSRLYQNSMLGFWGTMILNFFPLASFPRNQAHSIFSISFCLTSPPICSHLSPPLPFTRYTPSPSLRFQFFPVLYEER